MAEEVISSSIFFNDQNTLVPLEEEEEEEVEDDLHQSLINCHDSCSYHSKFLEMLGGVLLEMMYVSDAFMHVCMHTRRFTVTWVW
ncbi:hypothetical protein BVC80_1605g34 [Macleaya cordata]|uniref:Uncharacterized protein n=1 Tax=Macleaya cordata TaxID=56857 RepID=A0A200QA75_MACCD|nr:hypothetical protein BVC80_1605g34 [Macleaya cordata]